MRFHKSKVSALALFASVVLYSTAIFSTYFLSDPLPVPLTDQSDHAAVDFWITRYLAWHDANRHDPSVRRLVFRQNGAGIGDRVKALIAVYGYAVLTKRLLVIQWNDPYPLADVLSKRSQERFIFRKDLDSNGLDAQHGLDYKFKYFRNLPNPLVEKLASDVHTVTLKTGPPKSTPNMLRKRLSANRFGRESIPSFTPNIWKLAVRQLLERSKDVEIEASRIRRRFGICGHRERCLWGRKRYLSVHARIGHGVGENHWRFVRFQNRYRDIALCYARAVRRYAPEKGVTVFVATDTRDWIPIFADVMREEMPYARLVHVAGDAAHLARMKRSESGRAIFRSQFVEMALLGDAIRTIALRSGFSKAAFWMGQSEHYTQLNTIKCINERSPVETRMASGFLEMD